MSEDNAIDRLLAETDPHLLSQMLQGRAIVLRERLHRLAEEEDPLETAHHPDSQEASEAETLARRREAAMLRTWRRLSQANQEKILKILSQEMGPYYAAAFADQMQTAP